VTAALGGLWKGVEMRLGKKRAVGIAVDPAADTVEDPPTRSTSVEAGRSALPVHLEEPAAAQGRTPEATAPTPSR
jgi:hypothetical protein